MAQARGLELDVVRPGHGQQFDDRSGLAHELLVGLDSQQHMRRAAAVRDDDRALAGGTLGAAGVLVELSARIDGGLHSGDPGLDRQR